MCDRPQIYDRAGDENSSLSIYICGSARAQPYPKYILKQRNLEEIANRTLDHYNQRAEAFWEGTREHDVTQNIAAMLQHIAADDPLTLLDFGCGPGRDLKVFAGLGHIAIGLRDPRALPPWRGPTAAAQYGNRIFFSSIYLINISMASSPMRRFFTSRARNCRACCGNCMPV